MFSSFKDKPDAQKIIGDDSAAGRENVTQRIVDAVKIGFSSEKMRQVGTESLEASNFYNGAEPSGYNEEQNLFLAY